MIARRRPISRAASAVIRLFRGEAGAGLLLIAVATAAMAMANSAFAANYHALFHTPLTHSPIAKLDTLHLWINDGLMALFFFLVGLEIKREVLDGELSSPAQRRLPVVAAIAGMVLPAAVFLVVTGGDRALQPGWAIPAATDIAFAVGVLSLLGTRLPPSLRLFLLTVAIVDDLGAVAIIALVYTATVKLAWLAASAVVLAGLIICNRRGVGGNWPYVLGGLALWYTVLHSGVHATVAGVLAAMCVPLALDRQGDSPLLRMEHALAPLSAYIVVPLFGFVNAGVEIPSGGPAGLFTGLPLAVALGLFLGKQAGIFGAILGAERLGFAKRPEGTNALHLWGLSLLCGIGFTMSLFITQLAFPAQPALIEQAKLGVIAGSLVAALCGFTVLRLARR